MIHLETNLFLVQHLLLEFFSQLTVLVDLIILYKKKLIILDFQADISNLFVVKLFFLSFF